MTKEKAKLKDLKLKFTSLQDSYEELKTSHEKNARRLAMLRRIAPTRKSYPLIQVTCL